MQVLGASLRMGFAMSGKEALKLPSKCSQQVSNNRYTNVYVLLRYILNDDGDLKLEGSIKLQILFQSLAIRLKYDELYVQVLHNGVSKYLVRKHAAIHPSDCKRFFTSFISIAGSVKCFITAGLCNISFAPGLFIMSSYKIN